jgi:DNA-binding transcriptional regulator YiaG
MLEDVSTLPVTDRPTQTVVSVEEPPVVVRTQTTLSQLTDQIGFARNAVGVLHGQMDDLHQHVRAALLAARTERVKESAVQLLEELANLGFAWRNIARMVGVSVPAVQKWRRGEKMASDNQDKVATLLATCDLIRSSFFVDDVAAWFEIRILPTIPIRPMDLYASGDIDLLLDWVSQHEMDPERVLTLADPQWRERYASDFELFEADDGELALRRKGR